MRQERLGSNAYSETAEQVHCVIICGGFEMIKNIEDMPSSPSHQNTTYYYDYNTNKLGHSSTHPSIYPPTHPFFYSFIIYPSIHPPAIPSIHLFFFHSSNTY